MANNNNSNQRKPLNQLYQQQNDISEELLDNLDFDTANEFAQNNFNRDIYNQQIRNSIGYSNNAANSGEQVHNNFLDNRF